MQRIPVSNPIAPAAPRDFTAILITPEHKDYGTFRRLHTPNYQGATTLNIIALTWINAVKRKDDSPLTPEMIGMSIISLVNEDGSVTPVTTVIGALSTATADAPPHNGTYRYQVAQADTNGIIGEPIDAIEAVVVEKTWPGETEGATRLSEDESTKEDSAPAALATRKGDIIDTQGKQLESASPMPAQAGASKRAAEPEPARRSPR